jgi:glycosyltransferase involved in cell wall biosynthesis
MNQKKHTIGGLVTVVIPVKNEEANLPLCLESLKNFDEVIAVDSGSSDRTDAITNEYGRKLITFIWDGHFPKKRSWVLRTYPFKTEWVLFLDADERVTPEFEDELEKLLPATEHNAFWIGYNEWSLGIVLKHGDAMWKTALLRIGKGEYENIEESRWSSLDMEIHEHLIVKGSVGKISAKLEHHDKRSLEAYYDRHNKYSSWEAHRYLARRVESQWTFRQRMKYKMMKWLIFPWAYFFYAYIFKGGFLDGKTGFYYAVAKIFYFYQVQAKIYELERQHNEA